MKWLEDFLLDSDSRFIGSQVGTILGGVIVGICAWGKGAGIAAITIGGMSIIVVEVLITIVGISKLRRQ